MSVCLDIIETLSFPYRDTKLPLLLLINTFIAYNARRRSQLSLFFPSQKPHRLHSSRYDFRKLLALPSPQSLKKVMFISLCLRKTWELSFIHKQSHSSYSCHYVCRKGSKTSSFSHTIQSHIPHILTVTSAGNRRVWAGGTFVSVRGCVGGIGRHNGPGVAWGGREGIGHRTRGLPEECSCGEARRGDILCP